MRTTKEMQMSLRERKEKWMMMQKKKHKRTYYEYFITGPFLTLITGKTTKTMRQVRARSVKPLTVRIPRAKPRNRATTSNSHRCTCINIWSLSALGFGACLLYRINRILFIPFLKIQTIHFPEYISSCDIAREVPLCTHASSRRDGSRVQLSISVPTCIERPCARKFRKVSSYSCSSSIHLLYSILTK